MIEHRVYLVREHYDEIVRIGLREGMVDCLDLVPYDFDLIGLRAGFRQPLGEQARGLSRLATAKVVVFLDNDHVDVNAKATESADVIIPPVARGSNDSNATSRRKFVDKLEKTLDRRRVVCIVNEDANISDANEVEATRR